MSISTSQSGDEDLFEKDLKIAKRIVLYFRLIRKSTLIDIFK